MTKYFKHAALIAMLLLTACQQTASLEAPGKEFGEGAVDDFNIEPNTSMALFKASEIKDGKLGELPYGRMDAHLVTLDQITYMVDWNDLQDFKSLKKGEKINFRATGYIARREKSGENFRVIKLNEM